MASQPQPQDVQILQQHIKSKLYGIDLSFTIVAVIAVVLRFWARHRSAGSHSWDDWLVVLALCALFVSLGMNVIMIENGLGLEAEYVSLRQRINLGKALFGETINYLILLCLVKSAIIVMYCRAFPIRRFRVVSWILGTGIFIWTFMFVLLCIFQCSPVARAWDPTVKGTCLDLKAGYIGNAIPNILTDVFILTMPMWYVWKLHIPLTQRLAVMGIFLLGIFVIVASIYRFTRILALDVDNLSYTLKQPATWSHVELSTALICACLPIMRPLFTAFLRLIRLNPKSRQSSAQQPGSREIPRPTGGHARKNPDLALTELSVMDDGQASRTESVEVEYTDERPLNSVRV